MAQDNELEHMLKEATGPISFITMFLNLFGEKLHGENRSRATAVDGNAKSGWKT